MTFNKKKYDLNICHLMMTGYSCRLKFIPFKRCYLYKGGFKKINSQLLLRKQSTVH